MNLLIDGFKSAFFLILHLNPELWDIILLSLMVSGTALVAATILGLPLGAVIGLKRFRGKSIFISAMNTFMGLPPVVVGLFVYLLLSRSGPLGFMGLLYTPSAMIIAQTVLAILIVGGNIAGYTRVMTTTIALETDKGNFELALALGVILLVISLVINAILHIVQRKGMMEAGR